MPVSDQQDSVNLPSALRQQFGALERRLWMVETTAAICSAAAGLLISYLVLFVSDRIWDTPIWMRVFIAGAGFAIALVSVALWARVWVFQRRDLRALAILVQRTYRRLGDRLLGIVELADEKQRPPHFSADLYRAAIEQVARDANRYEFRDAVDVRPVRIAMAAALVLFVIALAPVLLAPQAGWNAFVRWIAPASATERFTLVRINDLPDEQIVPHGEPFQLAASVDYHSIWRPGRLKAQFEGQPKLSAPVNGDATVRLRLPAQVKEALLTVRLGDAKRKIRVIPTHRPSLTQLVAKVNLPEYLRYPPMEQNAQSGNLTVLEGSDVSFEGVATRELATASVTYETFDPKPLNVRTNTFLSGPTSLDGIFQAGFSWKDKFGLENTVPWRLTIQSQKDGPPMPELRDFEREIAILDTEVLQINALATDDFGVRELGISWAPLGELTLQSEEPPKRKLQADAGSPQEKKFEHQFRFSPALLKIPADSSVELRAFATDFYPGREPVESPVYRIHVLGKETHAELIRQRLESMLARLEEVTRFEEKITENTRDLKELSDEQIATEEAAEEIAQAESDQNVNATQLEQLANEAIRNLREAMRNSLVPEANVREWAKNVQEMQKLSDGQMQEAKESLKSAHQDESSRREDLAKALEKQEEALQALQEMQKQISRSLDDLQALTLAQRLRKVSSAESKIAQQLRKSIGDTIGLQHNDLPPKLQRANSFLANNQGDAQKESEMLRREISRFYERTQQQNYGEVSREMTDARTVEELDKVRGLIAENIAMEAIRNLASWSRQFNLWADKLEPKKEDAGGGSGSGGEGSGNDDLANFLMQQLMKLLRLREGEINVRDRTELVEQEKADQTSYGEGAEALYQQQRELLKTIVQMQLENPLEPLEQPLTEIYESMDQVGVLLGQPETGAATIIAENRAIDVMTDIVNLLNEQMQQGNSSSQQSATSEEMAFFMQMMAPQSQQQQGMQLSRNPGRSTAGGDTDQAATATPGEADGKTPGSRQVNKASGVIQNVPTEFREALENYFQGLEAKE